LKNHIYSISTDNDKNVIKAVTTMPLSWMMMNLMTMENLSKTLKCFQ